MSKWIFRLEVMFVIAITSFQVMSLLADNTPNLSDDDVNKIIQELSKGQSADPRVTFSAQFIDGRHVKFAPFFISMLKDKNKGNRGLGAYVLGNMGPAAESAIPALMESLEDEEFWGIKDWKVRDADFFNPGAAGALSKIGYPAIKPMIEGIHNKSSTSRRALIWALTKFETLPNELVPVLIDVLTNETESIEMRAGAAQVLGVMGPSAKESESKLIEVIGNMNDPLTENIHILPDFKTQKLYAEIEIMTDPRRLERVSPDYILKSIAFKALKKIRAENIPHYWDVFEPLGKVQKGTGNGPQIGLIQGGTAGCFLTLPPNKNEERMIFFDGTMNIDGKEINLKNLKPRYVENRDEKNEFLMLGEYYVRIDYDNNVAPTGSANDSDNGHFAENSTIKVKHGDEITILRAMAECGD